MKAVRFGGCRRQHERMAIENFMATLGGLSLDEALANVELDARAYGWDRSTVRELAHSVRMHFVKRKGSL